MRRFFDVCLKVQLFLTAVITVSVLMNANTFDLTQVKAQKDLLTFSGFIENKGQIADQEGNVNRDVRFLYVNGGFKCALKSGGFSYELSHLDYKETETEFAKYKGLPEFARKRPEFKWSSHRADIEFLNCNLNARIEKSGASEDYFNYYLGHTGNNGVLQVKYYQKIVYREIYPKIDIEFYVTGSSIKYDIIVKPGGNAEEVRMRFRGQDDILMTSEGKLRINTSEGWIEESLEKVYFMGDMASSDNNVNNVKANYRITGDVVNFQIADYDKSQTLVIDPGVVWGTYYGGVHREGINAVGHDELNNVLATGYTVSTSGIATSGAFKTTYSGGDFDAFLVKLDYSGKRLWGTYFGGEKVDIGQGVVADNVWHYVFLMGYTSSQTGISSQGAWQETYGMGYYDSFLAKFDLMGTRIWSTYYGGGDAHGLTGGEYIYAAAIDEKFNDVYFTGVASSSESIASSGAHQTRFGGDFDAMLVKFNTDGEREWGTYYGGEGFDGAYGITLDPSGYITIGGYTDSDNQYWWGEEIIATKNAYKETRTGNSDAFLARFNLRGTRQWGTYFGGSDQEIVYCTAADKFKNIYIGGETSSTNGISTAGSHQTTKDDGLTGFIAKFSSTGSRLWGTYYGGPRVEGVTSMRCNSNADLFVLGYTNSESGIATPGTYQPNFVGTVIMGVNPEPPPDSVIIGYYYDGYLVKFNGSGVRQWGTYVAGGNSDEPKSLVLDLNENFIIGGETKSTYWIGTQGTHQPNYADSSDGFIIKFGEFVKVTNISSPLCIGNSFQVTYETGREMNTGNIFTVQLSDSNGNFSNPVNIGTKAATGKGVITATIPMNTIPADGYRIRVTCSNPSSISADNGSDMTIYGLPKPVIQGDSIVCSRGDAVYRAVTGTVYQNRWFVTNGEFIGDSTLESCNIRWKDVGNGSIKCVQTNTQTGCVDSTQRSISINITPAPTIIGESEVIISSDESYRTTAQSFLNYKWTVTGGTLLTGDNGNEIEVHWGNIGTGYVKLVITHKQTGCKDSLTMTVAINATPINITGKKTVCAFSTEPYSISPEKDVTFKWSVSGGTLAGDDSDTLITVIWGKAGTGVLQIIRTNTLTQMKDTAVKNIKILDVPDVRFYGINEICGNDRATYIAVNTQGVTTKWSVYNGKIEGADNKDTVVIVWNDVKNGSDSTVIKGTVFLTQTSLETGCAFTKDLRVSISDNPDAIVKGPFAVCEKATEYYRTVNADPNYKNKWTVVRGTILGSPTDTLIEVEWGLTGKGVLKLVQTAGNNCVDSNVIEVNINPIPARPVIVQQGKTLVSSSNIGNQWFIDDVAIEGATEKQYSPDKSGYYSVQVTDSIGCVSLMSVPYYFDIDKVVDYEQSIMFVEIFPNPTKDEFKVIVKSDYIGNGKIVIRNLVGKTLFEREFYKTSDADFEVFDINGLASSIYLIEVQLGTNIYVQKVVKH
ncbi:T9SS C-terminal target domain-containing protein [Bacteroidetes/Chlorobi group bacterium ChocPot_Mid]|nr:MAG: T9SS C-terminal target domain-containing protein [Bacteroidetes/Chlorobi group bacterium ChocPot_Mid]